MSDDLPVGWVEIPLEKCVTILDSKRIPINNTERERLIKNKEKEELIPYYGATGQVGYINDFIFDEELVLLGEDGIAFYDPYKFKAYKIEGKSWVNNHAHVIKAMEGITTNSYLCHYLNQFNYQGYITGSTRLKLNQGRMKKIPIRLAPYEEQKRIAEKLEQLLTAVDATKNRLDKVPTILKRFRQSVLAAAVSGELTRDWREGNKISEPWSETSLESIAVSITDGDHQAPPKVAKGIPFFVISNLSAGKLDFDSVTRFVPQTYYDSLKESRVPNRGDILYTVTGSFGIPVIVDNDREFCFQRHIAIIKPNHEVVGHKYLMYALSSNEVMSQAISCATGTAQKTVPLKGLRKFLIPLPSRKEQVEITARINALFALADNCIEKYNKAQRKVTSLQASILTKAFKGELVPQDPNDEPAQILLEKISQAKREKKISKPARKRKKTMPSKAKKGSSFSITEILRDTKQPISAQQLLALYAPGSPESDEVEDFFVALRDCLSKNVIMRERRNDEDWFTLVTGAGAS